MITKGQAQQILEVGGGAILYWASNVRDVRVTAKDIIAAREAGVAPYGEVGDLVSLHFEAGGVSFTATPERIMELLAHTHPATIYDEPSEEEADKTIQLAVFGDVKFGLDTMSAGERAELDAALGTIRGEDEL